MTDNPLKDPATLTSRLPNELHNIIKVYSDVFKNTLASQQAEFVYLNNHHPKLIAQPIFSNAFENMSPESLEFREKVLDDINCEIIKSKIILYEVFLNLNYACITRFPVALFQMTGYVKFWRNLTQLFCTANRFTSLDLTALLSLKLLQSNNNPHLTILNVQGLSKLQDLEINYSNLEFLNLTGVHPLTKNKYGEVEISLLFKQLIKANSEEVRSEIMARLGANYNYEKCLQYIPEMATELFFPHYATAQATFLPFFGIHLNIENQVESQNLEDNIIQATSVDANYTPKCHL